MRLRKVRRTYGAESNLTPMIDVIFQLLIFFMVVSQFTSVAIETLTLPEARKGEEATGGQADRIIVNVHKDGRISLFGEQHTPDTLQATLKQQLEMQKKRRDRGASETPAATRVPVLLRADKDVPWDTAAEVLSAIQQCGIDKVRVAVTEAKDADGKW